MSTALANLDGKTIAEAAQLLTSEEDAAQNLADLGMEQALNAIKWRKQREVGLFLAHNYHGRILFDSALDREGLEEVRSRLVRAAKKPGAKTKDLRLITKSLCEIAKVKNDMALTELKAEEFVARRATKLVGEARDPAGKQVGHREGHSVNIFIKGNDRPVDAAKVIAEG